MYRSSGTVEFLFAELTAGLTFARIAIGAKPQDADKIERNRKNARKAYDSLLHFQENISLTGEEKKRYESGKSELKAALRCLGEQV